MSCFMTRWSCLGTSAQTIVLQLQTYFARGRTAFSSTKTQIQCNGTARLTSTTTHEQNTILKGGFLLDVIFARPRRYFLNSTECSNGIRKCRFSVEFALRHEFCHPENHCRPTWRSLRLPPRLRKVEINNILTAKLTKNAHYKPLLAPQTHLVYSGPIQRRMQHLFCSYLTNCNSHGADRSKQGMLGKAFDYREKKNTSRASSLCHSPDKQHPWQSGDQDLFKLPKLLGTRNLGSCPGRDQHHRLCKTEKSDARPLWERYMPQSICRMMGDEGLKRLAFTRNQMEFIDAGCELSFIELETNVLETKFAIMRFTLRPVCSSTRPEVVVGLGGP
ncbi:hypothetical protein F5883DRAFT_592208 [Diaporthe sp. PMI_573]|nr:hypothetical protein F5883DRAFT_592208 [Diaporthaceae sp. PMI_573]